jgi:hypothetical protein
MASKQTVDMIQPRTAPPSMEEADASHANLTDTRLLCAHLNEALLANAAIFDAYDRLHEDIDDAELRNRFKILCDRTANDILELENMIFGFGGTPALLMDMDENVTGFISAKDHTPDSDLNVVDASVESTDTDDMPKDYGSIH